MGIAGCGQQGQQTPTVEKSDGVAAVTSGVVRARYAATIVQDGLERRFEYEVIADGDRRVRITYVGAPAKDSKDRPDGSWTVWDGQVLLDYNPVDSPAYNRTEDMGGNPPPVFVFAEGSEHFTQRCADARRLRTHTLLARPAVRYACAPSTEPGNPPDGHEMSLDQATGLMLKDAAATFTVVATEIDLNPTVNADTFSTDLPAGAEDTTHP
jgi:hypothetical protein